MKRNLESKVVKYKLIYNPQAGKKRSLYSLKKNDASLEELDFLLKKYQILYDKIPTKRAGHATELANEAVKEGYKGVLVAGGDGTVGEVANGLIGSELPLGIIPLGSFMNIARMLSIPLDLEKAVQVIKIGRERKIDVGMITRMGGDILTLPHYFLESSSIGLEAQFHESFKKLEKGILSEVFKIFKTFFDFYTYSVDVWLDGKKQHTKVAAVIVSNGSLSGTALELAPEAKLNDHRLTVSTYKMTKYELIRLLINLVQGKKYTTSKIKTHQAENVVLETRYKRLVHADSRLFGSTPVEYKIVPNALRVVAGFPDPDQDFLKSRTLLDP